MEIKSAIEDLKIYFYDSLLSTDQFESEKEGTAYITYKPTEIKISAGVTSDSYSYLYYNGSFFNPKFSEFVAKLKLNSFSDCFIFFGFKESLDVPTTTMDESHAGIMIETSAGVPKLYFTTGRVYDGAYDQQKVEINTIDPTMMSEFKINYNKLYYRLLPYIISYLGVPTIQKQDREWSLLQTNNNYPPEDETHYLVFYIKNLTTTEKYILLNKVIYKEEYAD